MTPELPENVGLHMYLLENRLLQRSPVRHSDRHHPETSTCAEQRSSDRAPNAKTIPRQAAAEQPALVAG